MSQLKIGQLVSIVSGDCQVKPIGHFDHRVFLEESRTRSEAVTSLFQIFPAGELEAHNEYEKTINLVRMSKELRGTKVDMSFLVEKKNKLKQRMLEERERNLKLLGLKLGTPVCFGESVMLRHYATGMFLKGSYEVIEFGGEEGVVHANRLSLEENMNVYQKFVILPPYKIRKIGDIVRSHDEILLMNEKLRLFVSFRPKFEVIESPIAPCHYPSIEPSLFPYPMTQVFLVEDRRPWKMLSQGTCKEDTYLKGGQLFQLKFVEKNSYLACDYSYENEMVPLYLRDYHGKYYEEKDEITTYWQMEPVERDGKSPHVQLRTNVMLYTNQENKPTAGRYRLRHFLTGRTLKRTKLPSGKSLLVLRKSGSESEQAFFKVKKTIKDNDLLIENNQIFLLTIDDQYNIDAEDSYYELPIKRIATTKAKRTSGKEVDIEKYESIFEQLSNRQLQVSRQKLHVVKEEALKNSVRCVLKSREDNYQLFMLRSAAVILSALNTRIKNNVEDETKVISSYLFATSQQIVQALLFWLLGQEQEDDHLSSRSAHKLEGEPEVRRQKLCREFRLLELIMDLLYYMFKTMYQIENLAGLPVQVKEFLRCLYRLINLTICEYRPNEMFASQWIQLLIYHCKMEAQQGQELGAIQTLTELIDNNEQILTTKINDVVVHELLTIVANNQVTRNIKLLRALIVCDGATVPENQVRLIELMLAQKQDQLFYRLQAEPQGLAIRLHAKAYSLKSVTEAPEGTERHEAFLFFLEGLQFIEELCRNRNYISIRTFEQHYPQDACMLILEDPNYNERVRTRVVRLFLSLWLDRDPFKVVKLPSIVILSGKMGERGSMLHLDDGVQPDRRRIKRLVNKFIQEMLSRQPLINQQLRASFIGLILKVYEFGLYSELDENEYLLQQLWKVLVSLPQDSLTETKRDTVAILLNILYFKFDTVLRDFLQNNTQVNLEFSVVGSEENEHSRVALAVKDRGDQTASTTDSLGGLKEILPIDSPVINGERRPQAGPLFREKLIKLLEEGQDTDLNNITFKLSYWLYNERRCFFRLADRSILLQDKNTIMIYKSISEIMDELMRISEKSEEWLFSGSADQAPQQKNYLGALDLLEHIYVRRVSKDLNLEGQEKTLNSVFRLMNIPEQLFQILIDNYNHYIEHLGSRSDFTTDVFYRITLQTCAIVGCYARHDRAFSPNLKSQCLIASKIAREHPECEVYRLLKPALKNNASLLNDMKFLEGLLGATLDTVTKLLERKDERSYWEAGRYMSVLKNMHKVNDNIKKKNQYLILGYMLDKKYRRCFLELKNWTEVQAFGKQLEEFRKEFDSTSSIGSWVYYLKNFFQMLINVTCELNYATESKVEAFFSIEFLNLLIRSCGRFFYLKRVLVSLFYEIYINSEKKGSMFGADIERNLVIFMRELINDIEFLKTLDPTDLHRVVHRGDKQLTLLEICSSYFFKSLLPVLVSFGQAECKEIKVHHEKLFLLALEVSQRLLYSLAETRHPYQEVKALKVLISVKLGDGFKLSMIREHIRGELNQIPKMSQIKSFQHNPTAALLTVNADLLELRQAKFLAKAEENRVEQTIIKGEYRRFISLFQNEDAEDDQALNPKAVRALIANLLQPSNADAHELNFLRVQALKSLVQSVHPQESVDRWSPEVYEEHKVQIVRVQNELNQLKTPEAMVKLSIQYGQGGEICDELILLGIAVLYGGNGHSQAGFLEAFLVKQNGGFIQLIYSRMQSNFVQIERAMKEINSFNKEATISQSIQNSVLDEGDKAVGSNRPDPGVEFSEAMRALRLDLRFLQLLCEGHNKSLQSYLSCPRGEHARCNFVQLVSEFYNSYYKFINNSCIELGESIIDFLVECVQGPCQENQNIIVEMKVVHSVNDFLSKFTSVEDYAHHGIDDVEAVEGILAKSVLLLNSLLEGNYNEVAFIQEVYKSVNYASLIQRLETSFLLFKTRVGLEGVRTAAPSAILGRMDKHYDEQTYESYFLYIFLRTLADHIPECRKLLNEHSDPERATMLDFYDETTGSIEVNFSERLTRVYFPIQPICFKLTPHMSDILEEVPRNNIPEKQAGFVKRMEAAFDRIVHEENLTWSLFSLNREFLFALRYLCNFLVVLINVVLLAHNVRQFGSQVQYAPATMVQVFFGNKDIASTTQQILQIISFCQLSIFVLVIILWLVVEGPLVIKASWRELNEANFPKRGRLEEKIGRFRRLSEFEVVEVLLTYGPESEEYEQVKAQESAGSLHSVYLVLYNFYFCVSNSQFLYLTCFYLVMSVLGLTVSYLPYSFLLLDIVAKNEAALELFKAVTTNGGQIWATIFLSILLNYVYAVIMFYFQNNQFAYNVYSDGNPLSQFYENQCVDIFHCFYRILTLGFLKGGGPGDVSLAESSNTPLYFFARFVFNMVYFILLKLIMLNIIFGIIVDTFAQLREERANIEADSNSKCFICGIDREVFDQQANGLEFHVDEEHLPFNYIAFAYNLKLIPETERNGLETELGRLIKDKNQKWLPMLKAIVLARAK